MLIRFNAENWKSFPNLEFSAIASLERRRRKRVAKLRAPNMRILPISAIFGGNASGKSNFFEALQFAQRYIVDGIRPTQGIGVKPFLLDQESIARPTSFLFDILVNERVFRYSFSITRSEVLAEALVELLPTGQEHTLFNRTKEKISFQGNSGARDALNVVGEGTQKNLLFLTNSVLQKRSEFLAVYEWFQKTLLLISPLTTCNKSYMFANAGSPFQLQNQETLDDFDLGIKRIEAQEIPLEQLPFQVGVQIQGASENLSEGATFQYGPYLVSLMNGKLTVKKMFAVHSLDNASEREIFFELDDESDGTRRLLDLIPAFTFLRESKESRVVFIDELDRSLHHLLTRKLIEDYLEECSESSRTQLFFTTHDALLMDQEIFRRDELWLVEKKEARSELLSLDDFQIRYDKKILNAYLYGLLGGVPRLRG